MKIAAYIAPACRRALAAEIDAAGGNEVFFLGTLDEGRVVQVKALARGNREAVVAVAQGAQPGQVVIHNHPSGALVPSAADLGLAARLSEENVGFYIIDNRAGDLFVAVEPLPVPEIKPLAWAEVEAIFRPGGPLSREIDAYEERPGQLLMARDLTEAINRRQAALIEAGCGIGKSLAYLVPAALWAVANRRRVVISTWTINLQDQLMAKDIPLLQRLLPQECRAAQLKGRANYLCRRRLAEAASELSRIADGEEASSWQALAGWAAGSASGTYSDLTFPVPDDLWERVASDADLCPATRCPHHPDCFYYLARRQAAQSHLIVVNHHLLFSDLALRRGAAERLSPLLPPYEALILDEAHHIEEAATAHFGAGCERGALERLLSRLLHPKKKRGLLLTLAQKMKHHRGAQAEEVRQRLGPALTERLASARAFVQEQATALAASARQLLPNGEEGSGLRLTEEVAQQELYRREIKSRGLALAERLGELRQTLGEILRPLSALAEEEEALASPAQELGALLARLEGQRCCLADFFGPRDDAFVHWLSLGPKGRLGFYLSPLSVAEELHKALYQTVPILALTSATLTVNGSFDFFKSRSGLGKLPARRLLEETIPSPFAYAEQVFLGLPLDLPDPRQPAFTAELADFSLAAARLSGGACFLLFTSYKMMNEVYERLAPPLREEGMTPLRQGEMSRHQLLNAFRRGPRAILFATESFWEGVDVEGEALQSVVIAKLPFAAPSDPLIAARAERLAAQGQDGFADYLLPLAVLKLKQGFGRLIRKASDRGCVLLADRRLVEKQYGQTFLDSLPDCREVFAPREELLRMLARFFSDSDADGGLPLTKKAPGTI